MRLTEESLPAVAVPATVDQPALFPEEGLQSAAVHLGYRGPIACAAAGITYQQFLDEFAADCLTKELQTVEQVAGMAVLLAGPVTVAGAQSYPTKPIRLVAPFAQTVATGKRYCLVYSAGALADPRVATVHDWILSEARGADA